MESLKGFISHLNITDIEQWVQDNKVSAALIASVGAIGVGLVLKNVLFAPKNQPPRLPSQFPIIGNAIKFGDSPIEFLLNAYKNYGPVFTFTMFGSSLTYLLGTEASASFWASDNDILNAEEVYNNLTEPVFGEGVAYAVPHKIFLEQKQMAKEGLTKKRFAIYTGIIEDETKSFIERWPKNGRVDLLEDMSELIVYTATHCLHGEDTRAQCDAKVADLYMDLDRGFSPLAWFFPRWMPFPSFIRRDKAHIEMRRRFDAILDARRAENAKKGEDVESYDLMNTYLNTPYKKAYGGRKMTNSEVTGMMIALLMAGQHTSSTTLSWALFFIGADKDLQQKLVEEQKAAFKAKPGPFTLEHLDIMPLLHATVREVLRMRPPIYTIMRKAKQPFQVEVQGRKYVIPKGHQVCVSPTVNHMINDEWDNPQTFDINRFLKEGTDGKLEVTDGRQLQKGGKFKWVPFGAGRHRCIGFEFAQVQIRVVLSVLLRKFEFETPNGQVPPINFHTMLHQPESSEIIVRHRK